LIAVSRVSNQHDFLAIDQTRSRGNREIIGGYVQVSNQKVIAFAANAVAEVALRETLRARQIGKQI
jgi:hypothetical protein